MLRTSFSSEWKLKQGIQPLWKVLANRIIRKRAVQCVQATKLLQNRQTFTIDVIFSAFFLLLANFYYHMLLKGLCMCKLILVIFICIFSILNLLINIRLTNAKKIAHACATNIRPLFFSGRPVEESIGELTEQGEKLP